MHIKYFTFLFFCNLQLFAAFPADTLIKTEQSLVRIDQANTSDVVACIDCYGNHGFQRIRDRGIGKVHKQIVIVLDEDLIVTTADQRFYLPMEKRYKEAQYIKTGDQLLSYGGEYVCICDVFAVAEEEKEFFEISVDECHNFFVSRSEVLVHNVAPICIGLSWIFGEGAINFISASLGTALLGSAVGVKMKRDKDKGSSYSAYNAADNNFTNDAQAPGKPTENDGYEPPKNWDGKKVKNLNGSGYGYPDKKGNVWIPTGPGPNAHGGPHWDVQLPDGNHNNIVPGGGVRGKKRNNKR